MLTRANITDFLTQQMLVKRQICHTPSQSLRVSDLSSLSTSCFFFFSCARKCNSFIAKQRATVTLVKQSLLETVFVKVETKHKYVKDVNLITAE